ncbi:MAG: protein SCO1/2 [Marinoscillum sp.]|jgi:protein SCO1/2
MNKLIITVAIVVTCMSCGKVNSTYELPILGRSEIIETETESGTTYDTVYHTITDFAFVDQDSNMVTNETFTNQVYVADFFFTSCPTICPVMKQQMLRVYEVYKDNPKVGILSHSIDPEYDTVALLHEFAARLGITSDKWHFVTGDKEDIYEIGEKSYMVVANEDESAPGGFIHSGAFLLVDQKRRIRGVYDGTVPEQVDILINDIKRLTGSK